MNQTTAGDDGHIQPAQKIRTLRRVGSKQIVGIKDLFLTAQQLRQTDAGPDIGNIHIDHGKASSTGNTVFYHDKAKMTMDNPRRTPSGTAYKKYGYFLSCQVFLLDIQVPVWYNISCCQAENLERWEIP